MPGRRNGWCKGPEDETCFRYSGFKEASFPRGRYKREGGQRVGQRMLSNEVTFLLLLNLKVQGLPNSQVVLCTLLTLFPRNPEHRNQSTFCLHIWLTFCHLYFQGNILVYTSSCTLPLRTLTAYSTHTHVHTHPCTHMHTHSTVVGLFFSP